MKLDSWSFSANSCQLGGGAAELLEAMSVATMYTSVQQSWLKGLQRRGLVEDCSFFIILWRVRIEDLWLLEDTVLGLFVEGLIYEPLLVVLMITRRIVRWRILVLFEVCSSLVRDCVIRSGIRGEVNICIYRRCCSKRDGERIDISLMYRILEK